MTNSDERREVAKRLRDEAGEFRRLEKEWGHEPTIDLGDVTAVFQDVAHFAGLDGTVRTCVLLDRLADLIDPTCRIVSGDADNHMPHCNLCGTGNFDLLPKYCKGCGARIVYNENVN